MPAQMLTVDAELLRPNPWNPNVVSPENELKIEAAIKRAGGLFKPIIVRQVEGEQGYEILGGEHRWRVAQRMGYTSVPISNMGFIPDKLAKEVGEIDNGRYGENDVLKLAALFKDLGGDAEDLQSFLPMATDDLASIFAASTVALDDLDALEASASAEQAAPAERKAPTHQIMRFKVPVADVERISDQINTVMKRQGFTGDDSMMNAGNALVWLLNQPPAEA